MEEIRDPRDSSITVVGTFSANQPDPLWGSIWGSVSYETADQWARRHEYQKTHQGKFDRWPVRWYGVDSAGVLFPIDLQIEEEPSSDYWTRVTCTWKAGEQIYAIGVARRYEFP